MTNKGDLTFYRFFFFFFNQIGKGFKGASLSFSFFFLFFFKKNKNWKGMGSLLFLIPMKEKMEYQLRMLSNTKLKVDKN
jgi:hypothetical protein